MNIHNTDSCLNICINSFYTPERPLERFSTFWFNQNDLTTQPPSSVFDNANEHAAAAGLNSLEANCNKIHWADSAVAEDDAIAKYVSHNQESETREENFRQENARV